MLQLHRLLMACALLLTTHAQSRAGKLAGTVADREGKPVAGAEVWVRDLSSGKEKYLTADGAYVIDLSPGEYVLTANAEGYKPITSALTVKTNDTTVFNLIFEKRWSQFVSSITTSVLSLLTSLAVALAGRRVYLWIYRPKLIIEASNKPPFSHWINPEFPTSGTPFASSTIDIFFSRIRIKNVGKSDSEKVQVTVRRALQYNPIGPNPWNSIKHFVPLDLRWSNTWDVVKAGEDSHADNSTLVRDRIAEGGERFCDLGFLVAQDKYDEFCRRAGLREHLTESESRARFILAFEIVRTLERHSLRPGQYLLELVVDALQIKPKSFWLYLCIPNKVEGPKDQAAREGNLAGFKVCCSNFDPKWRDGLR